MKLPGIILLYFVLHACNGNIENCSLEDFEGFEMEKTDPANYSIFYKELSEGLKPGITYKFRNKPPVCFAEGKDFKLLSFSIDSVDISLDGLKTENKVSKIKLRKCYSKCGYLGKVLKFKLDNPKPSEQLVLNILSSSTNNKIFKRDLFYFEGTAKNLGLYIGKNEFIFLPTDNSGNSFEAELYMKIVLAKQGRKLLAYIFYSKNEITTDVLDKLDRIGQHEQHNLHSKDFQSK